MVSVNNSNYLVIYDLLPFYPLSPHYLLYGKEIVHTQSYGDLSLPRINESTKLCKISFYSQQVPGTLFSMVEKS